MNEDYAYNRKILYTIILFLLVSAGFGLKFYFVQKKENSALRVKILSLNKIKKKALPWSRLTEESRAAKEAKEAMNERGALPPVSKLINEIPIIDQSTEQLANTLTRNMLNIKKLSLAIVDKSIEIADEIISREPNSYSAYKAKLISMIVKENKFNQNIDEYELNKVLDNMAGLELSNDTAARREAALIATTNNQLTALEKKLSEISLLRDELSTQSAALDKTSPEYQELQAENEQLAASEQLAFENLENLQNNINNVNVSADYPNEDLVEIPFLRLLAKSDHDAVIENAQTLIEQFPNSPSGYFYLIRALELEGRNDEAIRAIEDSKLSPEAQGVLIDRLEVTSGDDPKKFWEKLRF